MEFWSRLHCPNCRHTDLRLSAGAAPSAGRVPEYGYLVCDHCQRLYPIAGQLVDMAVYGPRWDLTVAGWSNHFPPTPQLYERIWRRRALTLLTGEPFPVERELDLLNEWTALRPGEAVVDLGTSTGLYARGTVGRVAPPDGVVYAVDLAWGMLQEAKGYIARERCEGIVLLRAAAEALPFADESVDAVIVGGSCNELKSISTALVEAHRITRRGGRMFVMSLHKSARPLGLLVQRMVGMSGIKFPTVSQFNALTNEAGWQTTRQMQKGIVLFSLLSR